MPESLSQRVLIVDDEKNIRLTVTHALEPIGYEVSTAVTAEDALSQLEERPFDAVLLDLKLPGMDGLELLRELSCSRPDIPVVVISAHGTVEAAVEATRLGALDFIQKPFTPNEIRDAVRRAIDSRGDTPESDSDYEKRLQMARRCAMSRHPEAAMEHVRRAIGMDPSRPEAFNLLGELHETAGEHDEAVVNYRIAQDLDSAHERSRGNHCRPSDGNGGNGA